MRRLNPDLTQRFFPKGSFAFRVFYLGSSNRPELGRATTLCLDEFFHHFELAHVKILMPVEAIEILPDEFLTPLGLLLQKQVRFSNTLQSFIQSSRRSPPSAWVKPGNPSVCGHP
jgi:hypothetical protein